MPSIYTLTLTTLVSLSTAYSLPPNLHSRQALSDLKTGSWLLTWTPSMPNPQTYKGPLRITSNSSSLYISADLYNGTTNPDPADGSPILSRENYWAFVRPTKLSSTSNGGFDLGLEFYKYKGTPNPFNHYTDWESEPWEGGLSASLSASTAPAGFPSDTSYFSGNVTFAGNGSAAGTLSMGWVSDYVRRYTVEIGGVAGLERPLADASGTRTWKSIFADALIDMSLESGVDVPDQPNGIWDTAQAHAAMLQYRRPTNFDRVWRIYLLMVKKDRDVARGAMMDGKRDSNDPVPREAAVIANEWLIGTNADGSPDTQHAWPASVVGKPFVSLHDAWFRTAVHEVGHFFNLGHPAEFQNGLMDDTQTYVDAGEQGLTSKKFPENIDARALAFTGWERHFMAHRPDTHVRPGWIDFGAAAQDETPPVVLDLLA
ncbi:hypothetical protein BDV96DRAFT_639166 [Lophiotrema nucula]|uniref:Peptidase M43 pregnancy-associated plasma-A domain-containing protein n=1 Tax=Lophiotrema nucula TaxID=690887 RepID=A0A6A5ZTK1_9PLEO|nr:hypothetical protein BDV96DRAFT_639166 [Lophiotrema nucula]